MSLPAATREMLEQMLMDDAALRDRLAHTADPERAAALVAAAASRQGLRVTADDIKAHLTA